MFFLHALATKRKQLEQAGDIDALMNLPIVTVFEKSASPGGVWRSDRNRDNNNNTNNAEEKPGDTDESTNMYEGLWINGHKDGMEFFDYTFEDHFKTPQPVYLPRQQILEYIMARLSKHGDIFQDVLFNTEVQSVTYDDDLEQFVIVSRDKEGMISTRHFDKCIWASGENGKPNMPKDVTNKLGDFKGQVVHSSAMDKLVGSSSADGKKNKNAVEGKRILLIGDSYSAEDLALQCIKLGAEKIFMTSRKGSGCATSMGAWPHDKVEMLLYSQVAGVKDDGTGKTIVFEELEEDEPVLDAEDVSIIILCTGYKPNLSFLDDKLQPWKKDKDCGTWCMEDVGESTTAWRMKENVLTSTIGHVKPSKELDLNSDFVTENLYRKLLISNTNMMYIYESASYPLLEIDVMAWLCLAYITGKRPIPSREEMLETNKREILESMQELSIRYKLDEEFKAAWDEVPEEHWSNDTSDDRYEELENEENSYELRVLAGYMKDANYPMSLGDIHGLNKMGAKLLKMMWYESKGRYVLKHCDGETKKWKTFRDSEPSPYRSLVTGMGSVPLKGKWLEIDDEGNPASNIETQE